MTKASFPAALSLLLASSSLAQLPYTQEQVIAYAKSIDVQTLDPSLPSSASKTGSSSGHPAPTCIGELPTPAIPSQTTPKLSIPFAQRFCFTETIRGLTSTVRREIPDSDRNVSLGIVGRPKLDYGVGVYEGVHVPTGSSERLSDLPALLDQPVVTGNVQKLYIEIVGHHPMGIPAGETMAAIRPFLSKRLIEQLQTAQTCQDDYGVGSTLHGSSRPGWLKSGLFSGDGIHAAPVDAIVANKEKQNDGSFLVSVDLEPARCRDRSPPWFQRLSRWLHLGSRGSRDIRKGPIRDRRCSHLRSFPRCWSLTLLSESFSGCDGSHWSGIGVRK